MFAGFLICDERDPAARAALLHHTLAASILHGIYNLKDVATGRCLDSNASGSIYTNPCQPTNEYQQWYF